MKGAIAGNRRPMPSDRRADTLAPRPVATYVPPVRTLADVVYGGAEFNEPPIGMFNTARAPTSAPRKATSIHRFQTADGRRNSSTSRQGYRRPRGAVYGHIVAVLEHCGPLHSAEIEGHVRRRMHLGSRSTVSTALTILKRDGTVVHEGRGAPWRLA